MQNNKTTFLILKDTTTNGLKTEYPTFKIEFVSRVEAIRNIAKTKKKVGQLDKIETLVLSNGAVLNIY